MPALLGLVDQTDGELRGTEEAQQREPGALAAMTPKLPGTLRSSAANSRPRSERKPASRDPRRSAIGPRRRYYARAYIWNSSVHSRNRSIIA